MVGMPFGAIIALTDVSTIFCCLKSWIYTHETLTAGIIASGVALISVWRLNRQIKQAQQFREDDRTRQLAALKILLPTALKELNDYAQTALRTTVDMCLGRENPQQLSQFDEQYFRVFSDVARVSEAPFDARLHEVTILFQVQQARLKGWIDQYKPELGIDHDCADRRASVKHGAMFSVIELLLCIQELWGFARDKDEETPQLGTRVKRASELLRRIHAHPGSTVLASEIPRWPKFLTCFEERLESRGDKR